MTNKFTFKRSALVAAGLLAYAAAPAFAADAIDTIPEPVAPVEEAPVASWDGAYAGVQAGYGFGHAHEPGNKIKTKGFEGGAFAGYQAQLDNGIVAGVEGDVGYSDVKGNRNGTRVRSGVEGSVRGRLGYAVAPNVLPYATAGGAVKSMRVTEGGDSERDTNMGWTAGGGVDVKLTDKVFARGEYRYTDYADKSYSTGKGTRDVDSHDNRVQFGVGMQF